MAEKLSDAELRKKLSGEEFHVLREKGTETPFTGKLLHNRKKGDYKCKACGNILFESGMKFDSGTGWPSFDQAKKGAVKLERDESFGLGRTEAVCAKCGSHLGHVFYVGPTRTGTRYCIKTYCLDFKEKDE